MARGRIEVGCGDINDPVNGGVLASITYDPATGNWTSGVSWQSTRPPGSATAEFIYGVNGVNQSPVSVPPNRSGTITTTQLATAGLTNFANLTFFSLTCG